MGKENIVNGQSAGDNKAIDSALIYKVQQGDRDAFNELMLKYHRRVFNLALRILGDYTQADEVAQDAFVRAYRAVSGFRCECSFSTWMYRITVNLSRNYIKKKRRFNHLNTSFDNPVQSNDCPNSKYDIGNNAATADKILIDKEKQEIIEKAIQSLDEHFRSVVVLRDMEMLSYDEIAGILSINLGTVKSRLARARAILQEKLKDAV
ncbi:MAG: sigma-70 family RNA polymerase sigma factor [Candidatus Omnitrophica bacterium]|nr:sigma-70 family RNA polymerase sigma factor [Candidatus Omnitrophota bacterium]